MKRIAVFGLIVGAAVLLAGCSKQSSSTSTSGYSTSNYQAPTTQPVANPATTPTQTQGYSPAPAQNLDQADVNESMQLNNLDKQATNVDQSLNDKAIDV